MENLIKIKDTIIKLQCLYHDKELTNDSLCRVAFFLLTFLHNNQCHPEVYNAVVTQLLHISKILPDKNELRYSLDLMESWIEVLIKTKKIEHEKIN